jgi:hypothetical protein
MATESLIVELDARTEKLEAKLKSTDAKLNQLSTTTTKTSSSFGALSKVNSAVASGLGTTINVAKKAAGAFLAVKAAVTAAALVSAKYAKEIKNNSELMKLSVEETQAWASATQTVGIDMEKLGDISKDTSEKIGQMLTMGGGGFEDFGDVMGMTKEQTIDAAKEFKGMAGPDVLQAMVKQMEDAGVNAEQMSFALEGMASDTTKLIPLLTDGGAAVEKLKNDFYDTSVVLNETDITKLGELSTSFKVLGETFDGTMGKFSVEYADQINSMISTTQEGLKIVGDEFASGSFTDRINSFYDAFTDSWAVAMGDNISVFDDFTGDASKVITSLSRLWFEFALTLPINLAIGGNKIKEIFADILDEVKIKMAEANVFIQEGLDLVGLGDITGAQAALDAITTKTDARDEAHNSEIKRLQTEKDAILEKFYAEQEAATIKREQYGEDSATRMKLIADETAAEAKRVKGLKKGNSETKKSNAEQVKAEEKGKADLTKNAMILNQVLFDDNKAIGAGIIVAETAQNVVTSVKNSGGVPWGLPAGAAAAAMGIAQLAALKSSSKGGGSISGGGGSYSAPTAQSAAPEIETSTLDVTEQTETVSSEIRIVITDESGNEFLDGIANGLNERTRQGR